MENEFPPNSHSEREARPARTSEKVADRKVVERITRNKVVQRKKPLRKKFVEAFRPEDGSGFVEYTLLEVLVPGIKDAIADAASGIIDNALGVGGGHSRRRRGGGGGYTSYNRMGAARRGGRDRDDDRRGSRRDRDRVSRKSSDVPELIFETRVETEEVLDALIELISKYDAATMRDLLSLAGEPHNTTDEDWGWTDLRGARIHRLGREGYLLDLPRPEYLD